VTGPLVGGGSAKGPWLVRIDGQRSHRVGEDALQHLPVAATVAGLAEFHGHALALVGSSPDGEVPLDLLSSPNDRDWTVDTPANIDRRLRPQALIAIGDALALVGSRRLDGDPPTTRLTVYVTSEGRTWVERRDPLLDVEGRPNVQVAAAGSDLVIVASASTMAFSVGPPILLVGREAGTTWESYPLADLAGATIGAAIAAPGQLHLVGCAPTDPPTAVVWTYLLADPRAPETTVLSNTESCASAVAAIGDGYAIVGAVGRDAVGWHWYPETGEEELIHFPEESRSDADPRSLAAWGDDVIAAGSTRARPEPGGEQQAAAWVAGDVGAERAP
jgi:hypothetical protein